MKLWLQIEFQVDSHIFNLFIYLCESHCYKRLIINADLPI
jgi:hypothetical protein